MHIIESGRQHHQMADSDDAGWSDDEFDDETYENYGEDTQAVRQASEPVAPPVPPRVRSGQHEETSIACQLKKALSIREQAPAGHVPRSQRQLPPVPVQLNTQDSLDDENYEQMDRSPKTVHKSIPALPDRSTRPKVPRNGRQESMDEEYMEPVQEPVSKPTSRLSIRPMPPVPPRVVLTEFDDDYVEVPEEPLGNRPFPLPPLPQPPTVSRSARQDRSPVRSPAALKQRPNHAPEGDSVYEATDLYTSDSDRSSSPAKNVIPPRLRNLPPIPPEAERTPPSGGGKMSPKDRSKLAEPPTVRRQVPEKHPKTAITPPSGKNKQQTASSAAPSKASTEDKKPFAADEPKTVTENSNSNISDELRDMRSRLKPVKPPVGFPSKKDAEIEDRKSVNQTRVDNKPVRESRRPSKDATAPADGIAVLSESRATNGKAKSPSRKPNAAVESKALLLAPSPPLPSRTRQPSPSPQRNNEEASARSSEPRSESGRDVVKATAVVAREKGGVVNNGHLPSKDSGLRTTAAREPTPTRLTDNKLSESPKSAGGKPAKQDHRPLPPVPPNNDEMFDELGRQPWYVGDVSRRSAESMVRSCDYDGAFVVRQSQKGGTDNPFTLTLLYASTVYNLHVRRRRTDDKFSIGKEKPGEVVFATVTELVSFYQNNGVELLGESRRNLPVGKVKLRSI